MNTIAYNSGYQDALEWAARVERKDVVTGLPKPGLLSPSQLLTDGTIRFSPSLLTWVLGLSHREARERTGGWSDACESYDIGWTHGIEAALQEGDVS